MQELLQTLQDEDIGRLAIIAELWGIDLSPGPALQVSKRLVKMMLDPALASEIVEGLPQTVHEALAFINRNNGRVALADLARRFGEIRKMGPGRRDREKPWRNPISPVESLWYYGLIARRFSDTPSGPQEFAFIPSDLRRLFPMQPSEQEAPFGRPSQPPASILAGTSAAVDDTTTILAAFRRQPAVSLPLPKQRQQELTPFLIQPESLPLLINLLDQKGILSPPPIAPFSESVRPLLEANRGDVLAWLLSAWKNSVAWNDLAHTPDINCANESWPNDPLVGRHAILNFLGNIPPGAWWDLDSFISATEDHQPAFQRTAGDFDSWYLRSASTLKFLRGFQYWSAIEGALIRYTICGPLHWLGATDLATREECKMAAAFRLTPASSVLLKDKDKAPSSADETGLPVIRADGKIIIPRSGHRAWRYQISRFTEWQKLDHHAYCFQVTPASLRLALEQGLSVTQILALLRSADGVKLPSSLAKTIQRWEKKGTEARIEHLIVLRLKSPEMLHRLRNNRSTRRYLREVLSETNVVIRKNDIEHLYAAAARIGLLIDLSHSK